MSQVTDTVTLSSQNLHQLEKLSGSGSHLAVFQLKFARSKKAGEILRMKILTEIFFKEGTGKTNKKTRNV